MDRATAIRVLGLGAIPEPDERAVQGAYWRLRAHLERRCALVDSAAARAECMAQLASLGQALGTVSTGRFSRMRAAPRRASGASVFAWAAAWVGLALLLVSSLWNQWPTQGTAASVGPSSASQPDGFGARAVDSSPGEPAQLIVAANLEGSQLLIVRSVDSKHVAEGPADGSGYTLPPGAYVLQIGNPECADLWVSEIVLEAGEQRRVQAANCERNGWLVVRSNVSGDRVTIDSRAVGGSGSRKHSLSAGEHRLLVEKDGYLPWEAVVRIEGAKLVTLRATLEQAGSNAASASSEVSEILEDLPEKGRQHQARAGWHEEIRGWLLARYDADVSGRFDSEAEVLSIPCKDWLDIEGTYDQAELGLSLIHAYGFDGSTWVDGALGFDRSVRNVAYARMKACGLRSADAGLRSDSGPKSRDAISRAGNGMGSADPSASARRPAAERG